jgi:hypothetical protein
VLHFCSLKSSVNEAGTVALVFVFAFAFAFELLVFAFVVTFALRFSLRPFAFALFVLVDRLASAMSSTTKPAPTTISAMSPPTIHQIAFDFFRGGGAGVGLGVHCGGGTGAGGGGVGTGVVRLGVGGVTAGSGR